MSSPASKRQKTSEITNADQILQQIANEERQKQQESDEKQQHIPPHAGLKDQVLDQIAQQITDEEQEKQQDSDDLENLRCQDEENLKKEIHDAEKGEVEGDHLSNIEMYLRNQQPALFVTSLDTDDRATVIDDMLGSEEAVSYPLAAHLAVQVFDHYFATFSQDEAVNALSPQIVLSSAFGVAVKHLYAIEASAQNQGVVFQILNPVHYRLNTPTTKMLVDAVLVSTGPHASILDHLCSYLTELALLDRDCSGFQISVLAAGCLFLGQFILDSNAPRVQAPWQCDAQRFRDAVTILQDLFLGRRLPHCHYVRTKYSDIGRTTLQLCLAQLRSPTATSELRSPTVSFFFWIKYD